MGYIFNYLMNKQFVVLILLFFVFSFVSAATLRGTVYEWFSFRPLDNAIIQINTIPQQSIVSQNGEYSFQLPKGKYLLHAEYFEKAKLLYVADENVTIVNDGNFVLDLVMFPSTDFNASDFVPIDSFDQNDLIVQQQQQSQKNFESFLPFIAGIVVIIIILILVYFLLQKKKKKESLLPMQIPKEELVEVKKQTSSIVSMPVDLAQSNNSSIDKTAQGVMDVLKRYGGRMTQKDLREKTDIGEAKLSLIVAELESMQLVKKIKQGRGNIIVLK